MYYVLIHILSRDYICLNLHICNLFLTGHYPADRQPAVPVWGTHGVTRLPMRNA